MSHSTQRCLWVGIIGPTGSGKSSLSVALGKTFDVEIVNCDALQVYRKIDIGTGKIDFAARNGITHHLLDVVGPDREFSAAEFIQLAAPIIREIDRKSRLPLVVGGTGLYIRSLLRGLFEGPGREPELRSRIFKIAERRDSYFVHRMLNRLDKVSAARIHPHDLVRVVRALEVSLLSRRPMSEVMKERRSLLSEYRSLLIGVAAVREVLVKRIESRDKQLFAQGLVDEVRQLSQEYGSDLPAFKAIGYREVVRYLAGEINLTEAQRLTSQATRQYSKRQMTWFRRETGVTWFSGAGDDPGVERAVSAYLQKTIESLDKANEEPLHAKTAS